LIQAILNADEEDVAELVRQIRTCDNLEELASTIEAREKGAQDDAPDSPMLNDGHGDIPQFEAELSGKMGDLWLDGSVKFIGGTSNLIWMPDHMDTRTVVSSPSSVAEIVRPKEEAILSWTTVTQDKALILHFINMYFCWHYSYFTTLAKELFYRDFLTGTSSQYCSALLVNVMLALGCHFSSRRAARANPDDSATTGDHFFKEAKRLLHEDDEFANAKLCTVQALALMSVREAGCARESKGWVYSGMSFRMALDLGLNVDAPPINEMSRLSDEDIDARRVTFWGCFLFDKCWSNYLGRQPQLQNSNITVQKPEVFPFEDSEMWSPYSDSGIIQAYAQPARTRTIALQISKLAEMSGDLLVSFYHPQLLDKPLGKQAELKKLSDLHTRLEAWNKELPPELEAKDSQLPQVLLMHMFYQLLYIHLYRPFLKYNRATSPLPSHVSPRKFCTQAAGAISKLFRLYKRTHGLRQICNIAVYIAHTACSIHILNLPDKNAKRDIVHGLKHLEEMGECWTAARRTLQILHLCAEKWKVELPEEADAAFARATLRWGLLLSAPSPASPAKINSMLSQLSSQPMEDLMGQSVQRQQEQPHLPQQISYNLTSTMAQIQPGMSATMAPSPATTIDTRRSSGNLSLPPQNAADFGRAAGRMKSSTMMSKEQQEVWNAHQARLSSRSNPGSVPTSTSGQASNAAKLFGGVDSLMEETQDWWFQDQSQFALGFDNWNSPSQDWFGFDANGVGIAGGSPNNNDTGSMDVSQFPVGNRMNQSVNRYGHQSQQNTNSFGGNGTHVRSDSAGAQGYPIQRSSFDDDMYY
jgi:Fungal specific transcription factor domain